MHDHTLIGFNVSWAKGEVVLTLKGEDSSIYQKKFVDVVGVSMTHTSPWGDSSSVNDYSSRIVDGSRISNVVEMQSGDTIEIVTLLMSSTASNG